MSDTLYVLEITKKDIASLSLVRVKNLVSQLEVRNQHGEDLANSLCIMFQGYDDVSEEVFEIDEIRRWTMTLYNEMPYIFYFLNRDIKADTLILSCLLDFKTLKNDQLKEQPVILVNNDKIMHRISDEILKYGKRIADPSGALKKATYLTSLFA